MSARAITWAWEQETKSSGERLVLIALADRADDDGHCWPSAEWLGRKTNLNERSVRRHLDSLEERGLLRRERRHRNNGQLGVYDYYLDVIITVGTTGHQRPVDHRTPTPGSPPDTSARAETTIPETTNERPDGLSAIVVCDDGGSFDAFYDQYPRKVGKGAARKAWQRLDPQERIMAIAAASFLSEVYDTARANAEPARALEMQKFTPHPATWLNQQRWEDDPDEVMGTYAARTRQGQQSAKDRAMDAVLDQMFPEESRKP